MSHSFYSLLDISQSASAEDIKRAYKKAALKHHPDKGGDEAHFQNIQAAYEVLKDDEKRRIYNQLGDEGWKQHEQQSHQPPQQNPMHMFNQFFNFGHHQQQQQQPQIRRRSDHTHEISISLRDAFTGMRKNLNINVAKRCFRCLITCQNCKGTGQITQFMQQGPFTLQNTIPCQTCNGQGMSRAKSTSIECSSCNGKGEYHEPHAAELVIPAGAPNGFRIRFPGKGEQQMKETGEEPGDLHIIINITPHETLRREGADLIYTHSIKWRDSVVGTEITIPTIDNEPLIIKTAEFGILQPNLQYRVRGRGMPTQDSVRGDLVIVFTIVYPSQPLAEEIRTIIGAAIDSV